MPSMLEATKALLDSVKHSFGDHGELSNPEHPLFKPVADVDAALAELEQMTQDRPVPAKQQVIRNPEDLQVVLESPNSTDRDVQFRFSEKGLKIVVVDSSVEAQPVLDEQDFALGELQAADGSLAIGR